MLFSLSFFFSNSVGQEASSKFSQDEKTEEVAVTRRREIHRSKEEKKNKKKKGKQREREKNDS